jgi:hypothetical protein
MKREQVLRLLDCPNSLKDQAINAGIIAGFNFFSTLAGVGVTGLTQDPVVALTAAAVSAGLGFFASLITQRGLKKPEE